MRTCWAQQDVPASERSGRRPTPVRPGRATARSFPETCSRLLLPKTDARGGETGPPKASKRPVSGCSVDLPDVLRRGESGRPWIGVVRHLAARLSTASRNAGFGVVGSSSDPSPGGPAMPHRHVAASPCAPPPAGPVPAYPVAVVRSRAHARSRRDLCDFLNGRIGPAIARARWRWGAGLR